MLSVFGDSVSIYRNNECAIGLSLIEGEVGSNK